MAYDEFFQPGLQLRSDRVIMRVLQPDDLESLWAISQEPAIWTWFNRHLFIRSELETWVAEALLQQEQKIRCPFVVIDRLSDSIAGSTSLMSMSFPDRRIEIGSTWYGEDFRGTGINLHCKYLLLNYAFDTMDFERVEIKTDALNARSRAAILKLGMTQEGILRSHMQMPGNRRRDSVYYSLLKSEWPAAKESLLNRL
ncbi:GNAT family N-acetyltransferase [Flavihumibacter fluvii]|uniref:GNAT family N-acetyltransferase n=1 Tax=Flavihumibacter fluvii TaxID=2838157 RepID=UPI001BDF3FAB|nr:GNAT family N-acetyltransferase [Flavihumibacter fluvii]ULQ51544.1 GNAT family N-acetyltransferase [Flavihumibacter fluvii]